MGSCSWGHLSDVFLNSSDNIASIAKDNNGNGKDGPCIYKNSESPPFKLKNLWVSEISNLENPS